LPVRSPVHDERARSIARARSVILYAGADVRVPLTGLDRDWNDIRREHFLVKTDVSQPLSIDRTVWGLPIEEAAATIGDPLPWVTIDEVRRKADAAALRAVVLVIGLVVADGTEANEANRRMGIDTELAIQPSWQFLGFDVADGSISGLCNCGFENDEAAVLRPTWAPRLNDHGLLRDAADAFAFRDLTNTRVPEHAPFFVYGLWVLPSDEKT
jgi:hypothetical protein